MLVNFKMKQRIVQGLTVVRRAIQVQIGASRQSVSVSTGILQNIHISQITPAPSMIQCRSMCSVTEGTSSKKSRAKSQIQNERLTFKCQWDPTESSCTPKKYVKGYGLGSLVSGRQWASHHSWSCSGCSHPRSRCIPHLDPLGSRRRGSKILWNVAFFLMRTSVTLQVQ